MRIAESEVIKSAFKIENKNYPSVHGIWIFIHAKTVNIFVQEEWGTNRKQNGR